MSVNQNFLGFNIPLIRRYLSSISRVLDISQSPGQINMIQLVQYRGIKTTASKPNAACHLLSFIKFYQDTIILIYLHNVYDCSMEDFRSCDKDRMVCVCAQSLSHVQLFATQWTAPARLLCPWDSPDKNTGVGCHTLLQGIFPTQGSNPGLLHCRWILYCLNHQANMACKASKISYLTFYSKSLLRIVLCKAMCLDDQGPIDLQSKRLT